MKFDVTRFLGFTALLATSALAVSACTVNSASTGANGGGGGSTGTGGSATGGMTGTGGAVGDAGGATGNADGDTTGDATGSSDGATGNAGADGNTTGDAGADGEPAACLGEPGDAGVEGLCDGFVEGCGPTQEDASPRSNLCWSAQLGMLPSAIAALVPCLNQVADKCSAAEAKACATGLFGKACKTAGSAAACTAIHGNCADLTESACAQALDLFTQDAQTSAIGCMDPANEFFDPTFQGTCSDRFLVLCLSITP
jgi:hypothetical protein